MVGQTLAGVGTHVASLCNFNDNLLNFSQYCFPVINIYNYTLHTHLLKKQLIIVQKLLHFFIKSCAFILM